MNKKSSHKEKIFIYSWLGMGDMPRIAYRVIRTSVRIVIVFILVGDEGEETNALVSESTRTKWVVRRLIDIIMVGDEGFEPPVPDSESGALPLGESPTCEWV